MSAHLRTAAALPFAALLCLGSLPVRAAGATALPKKAAAFVPRDRGYDVQGYKIELDLDAKTGAFTGRTAVTLVPARPLSRLELDLQGPEATAAHLESGAALKLSSGRSGTHAGEDLLFLDAAAPLPKGVSATVIIETRGTVGSEQNGMFRAQDPARPGSPPIYATQFEPQGARRIFPCNDQPQDKATSEVGVTVDAAFRVYSNGRQLEDLPAGPGRHRVRWVQDKPHSTYLISILAAQFESVRAEVHGVPLAVHSAPGTQEQAKASLDALARVIPFYEKLLGVPFPWAKQDIFALPLFVYGGMENTSVIVNNDRSIGTLDLAAPGGQLRPFGLVAHETAHQWFGDLVTMRWWDDVWLNESLATLMQQEASAALISPDERVHDLPDVFFKYFRQEDGPRSHSIVGPVLSDPQDAFDSINYQKGAQVLRTLFTSIGREQFLRGLSSYLQTFQYGNATNVDLIAAMERTSGEDLQPFRKAWLLSRGYPIFRAKWTWAKAAAGGGALPGAGAGLATLEVAQRPNHAEDKTVFPCKLPVVLRRRSAPAYDVQVSLPVRGATARMTVPLPAEPEWVSWNDGFGVLGRIVVQNGEEEALRLVADDPDPAARAAALFTAGWPLFDRESEAQPDVSPRLRAALAKVIADDASAAVREEVLNALVKARFPVPQEVVAPALAVAKQYAQTRDREWFKVRNEAWGALAKAGSAEGIALARAAALDPKSDRPTLTAAAAALAMAKDLPSLKAALEAQSPRGYPYRRAILSELQNVRDPAVVPLLQQLLTESAGNDELVQYLFNNLENNPEVVRSPEGAAFLERVITESALNVSDEVRARALQQMENARSEAGAAALERIARKATSPRLVQNARILLEGVRKKLGAGDRKG